MPDALLYLIFRQRKSSHKAALRRLIHKHYFTRLLVLIMQDYTSIIHEYHENWNNTVCVKQCTTLKVNPRNIYEISVVT